MQITVCNRRRSASGKRDLAVCYRAEVPKGLGLRGWSDLPDHLRDGRLPTVPHARQSSAPTNAATPPARTRIASIP